MANNTQIEIISSPKGVARYPHLIDPDTKFDPQYNVKLVPSVEDSEAFLAQLVALFDADYDAACKRSGQAIKLAPYPYPWSVDIDKDTDEPTGKTVFLFKLKAKGFSPKTGRKWDNHFAWLNAARQPISVPENGIGGGSILRIAFEPYTWINNGFGMTLRIKLVQVLEQKTYTADNAALADKLFEVEEGFAGQEETSEAPTVSGADF